MDGTNILFWIVAISTASTLINALARHRSSAQGWIAVSLTVLGALFFAWLRRDNTFLYVAVGMWVLLILTPSLLATFYNKALLQQQYSAAHRYCRLIAILHPFDGWREQPKIVHALELAYQGDLTRAVELLKEFQHVVSPASQTAMINLYRLTNRWEEFLEWVRQLPDEDIANSSIVPVLLRAYAETGNLHGMVEIYDRNKAAIASLVPATNRDFCRLVLFAFSGRREMVQRLFDGPLNLLPNPTRDFWLATAELTGGQAESARQKLESQIQTADPSTRRAIERRLSKPMSTAASLGSAHIRIIEEAAREQGHEEIFHAKPPLLSKKAIVTQILIALNLLMFAREMRYGDTTTRAGLIKLGALYPPAVHSGEWWRLITAMFLHAGIPHIAMNMLCLWSLGPFVEAAFGSLRFALIYFIAGIGSMFMVMQFASGPHGIQITVGASGSIMGLVGAIGAVALLGWLRHQAHPAKEQLRRIVTIILMQSVIDAMIPQISMTAHLTGALFGFLTALILANKLAPNNN